MTIRIHFKVIFIHLDTVLIGIKRVVIFSCFRIDVQRPQESEVAIRSSSIIQQRQTDAPYADWAVLLKGTKLLLGKSSIRRGFRSNTPGADRLYYAIFRIPFLFRALVLKHDGYGLKQDSCVQAK